MRQPVQPFTEPWRTTALRTGSLALAVGVGVGLLKRQLAVVPLVALLALWFTLGGHFLEVPNTDINGVEDGSWYPLAHLRIGEYYQERGDKAKALDYLTKFTAMWKEADADLQPKVKEAKARIAELAGEKKP